MALGDPYCSLEEVKDYLKIGNSKTGLDALLEKCIASSTSEIERACNRQFNQVEQESSFNATTAREYYPESKELCYVDDFYTKDDLIVEVAGAVWVLDVDYKVEPLNGIVDGQPGWPYWKIRPKRGNTFPTWIEGPQVRVTALWGWEQVPAPIRQACLIMSAESFELKDAPFGVAGMDQFGTQLRVRDNRIAAAKIARYARSRIMVG